ncbi:hypothetical protein SBOR_6291 [Sclerotinia borealis F-4128]|uniref:Uncharacterized protein n=1 Tax=Sclerotinia borealis (strain F-4128) TaxID=1432307 RepID=W9CFM8_SCLBF|nr:hypothetical protein SBOR_6291 [Sclerotinia borealis F-4128]
MISRTYDVLKMAGDFAETIEDGYLVEGIPGQFRDAGEDLRGYYSNYVKNTDPFARSMHDLLGELDNIDFHWEAFARSRNNAITSVKDQVTSSRQIFQEEFDKLGQKKGNWARWWLRQWKRFLLDEPYEAHFKGASFMNITGDIDHYISMWRKTTIPDLEYRLTSTKGGSHGGLPGKIREVRDRWPKRYWGNKGFRTAPVEGLEYVRDKAVSVLKGADQVYEGLGYAINLLDKGGGYNLGGGFGWWHLKELLGNFDQAVKKLDDAEWKVRERQDSRRD